MVWLLGVALLLLTACQEPPTRRLPSENDAWTDMAAWFAERGIRVPEHPPQPISGKSASITGGLIGDIDETGRVDFHDALLLFLWLSNPNYPVTFNGQNLADIDRSGVTDWEDLWHLGTWLFTEPRPPNVFRIGQPLVVEEDSRFDIELVFVPGHRYSRYQQNLFRHAAGIWEKVIVGDIEDWDFSDDPLDTNDLEWWGSHHSERRFGRLVIRGIVDDVRVYVTTGKWDEERTLGYGGSPWYDPDTGFPVIGTAILSEDYLAEGSTEEILSTMVHELGHVLGIGGVSWGNRLVNPSENVPTADTYFRGNQARLAFRAAGGTWYRNSRRGVPVENQGDDGHWRESILDHEIMTAEAEGNRETLSLITIQALADMGYEVDVGQAEPYQVPARGAAKVVAGEPRWRCGGRTMGKSPIPAQRPRGEF